MAKKYLTKSKPAAKQAPKKYQFAGANSSTYNQVANPYYVSGTYADQAKQQANYFYGQANQFGDYAATSDIRAAQADKEREQAKKDAITQTEEAKKQETQAYGQQLAKAAGSEALSVGKEKLAEMAAKKATEKAATDALATAGSTAGSAITPAATNTIAQGIAPALTTQAARGSGMEAARLAGNMIDETGSVVLPQAANTGAGVGNAVAAGAGTAAKTGLMAANMSGLASAGIGLGLTGAGMLVQRKMNTDPTKFDKKEGKQNMFGDALKSAGSGFGMGATAGTIIPGVGNVIGGIAGGLAGFGVGLVKGMKENKESKKYANEYAAEEARIASENAARKKILDTQASEIAQNYGNSFVKSRLSGLQTGFGYNTSTNMNMEPTSSFYGETGGARVPGGKIVPIEGSDAVEFVGKKHSEGGIALDAQTEVEGGETMDQVMMAKSGGKGNKNDYFFSAYLKLGGKSFAQRHKEILKSGGNQMQIQDLAKMQESVANKKGETDRGPEQIAKYGGIHQYEKGGKKQLPPGSKNYIDSTPWSSAFISYVYSNADPNFPKSPTHTGYATGLKSRDDWEELDPASTKIQPGDIIVNNRSGNKQKFGQDSYYGFSHGDIVTKIDGDKVYSIGGNVDPDNVDSDTPDTVAERSKSLKNGILADTGYFVVLRPKNPQIAQRAVEVATNEKQLWETNKWNEHADTSQARLQTYYQSGKLGMPGVKPDDGKPAAAVQAQADGQPMSAEEYAKLNNGRPPLPSGAAQSVLGPIDYALLGVGRAIAAGTRGVAGAAAGAYEGLVGTAAKPNMGVSRPGPLPGLGGGAMPKPFTPGTGVAPYTGPGSAVGPFTGNAARPGQSFDAVPVSGVGPYLGGKTRPPITIDVPALGSPKAGFPIASLLRPEIPDSSATAQKAVGFTPTPFGVTPAATTDPTTAVVDPGTEGPFPGDGYFPTDVAVDKKDEVITKEEDIAKKDDKTERDKTVPPRNKRINGALLAGLGQLLPVGYALFKGYKTEGKLERMKGAGNVGATSVKGAVLPRVNMNAERASSERNTVAIKNAIQNTNAGPGGIAAMLAANTAQNNQSLTIANQEQRANRELAGEEARLGMQASMSNAEMAQRANMANVQNNLAVNQANLETSNQEARLKIDEKRYKDERTLGALDTAAGRIASIYRDDRSYKTQERLANAMDDAGSYKRFEYYEDLKKQAKDKDSQFYGKTDKELKDYSAQQYNDYIDTVKTGGIRKTRKYTSRLGELSKGKKTFNI